MQCIIHTQYIVQCAMYNNTLYIYVQYSVHCILIEMKSTEDERKMGRKQMKVEGVEELGKEKRREQRKKSKTERTEGEGLEAGGEGTGRENR